MDAQVHFQPSGRSIRVPAGTTLLEATHRAGLPMASACGADGICGRCGVEVLTGAAALSPERLEDDAVISDLVFDPFGVCAAITPWNFPVSMPHWAVVPALMAGNTVVLKPSEKTPLVADEYIRLLREHLPEGVVQVVHGDEEQGRALVAADVQLIAFTGSRRRSPC